MRKIDGKGKSIREILKDQRYSIDYYQREYRWQTKQVQELVEDGGEDRARLALAETRDPLDDGLGALIARPEEPDDGPARIGVELQRQPSDGEAARPHGGLLRADPPSKVSAGVS